MAVVAFFRPEIWGWFSRRLKPGKMRLDATTFVEIGFNGLGPVVAFSGVLRPLQRSHFIEAMTATVVREKDKATHHYQWVASRTTGIRIGWDPAGPPPPIEFPAPFFADLNEPRAISPVFTEDEVRSEMEAATARVNEEWTNFREQDTLANPNDNTEQRFLRFAAGKVVPFFAEINKQIYWQAGRHRLEICVTTSEPNRVYQFAWDFELKGTGCSAHPVERWKDLAPGVWPVRSRFQFRLPPVEPRHHRSVSRIAGP